MDSDYSSPLFPNPISCLVAVLTQFYHELLNRLPHNGIIPWIQECWEWHYICFYIGMSELTHIVLIAIGLTLFRIVLNAVVLKPIPKYFKFPEENQNKFPDSVWKSIVYTVMWTWAFYLCCVSEEQYFFRLDNHWEGFAPGKYVPSNVYWLYMLQIGFYIHFSYASIFIETIRNDFHVLLLHHFVTISLLAYSYAVRLHTIGLLLLFIQDIGDVSLESTKSLLYFKTRDGKDYQWVENIANIGFAFFTIQWVVFRLYWFFTKVIYSSAYVSVMVYPNGPFYLPFNILLVVDYGMQIYWFTLIVKMLVKIVRGGLIEDAREIEESDDKAKKTE